jgi:DNA-directed RNA polymerase specialized sigma subunit
MPKQKELTLDDLDGLTIDEVDEMIRKAIQSTRPDFARYSYSKDLFVATEQRLYAYPVIKKRIELDYRRLDKYLLQCGNCNPDDEASESLIAEIRAKIITNEHEVWEIDNAIKCIVSDEYAKIIPCLFFEWKTVDQTAKIVGCASATVFRQKSRLVQEIAVYLYGVYDAVTFA